MDLLQREHPEILSGIWGGVCKKYLSAYKSSNIYDTGQDKSKVTIDDQ